MNFQRFQLRQVYIQQSWTFSLIYEKNRTYVWSLILLDMQMRYFNDWMLEIYHVFFFWFTHVPNIQTSISSQFQHMRWKCDVKATHSHTLTRLFSFSQSLLFFNCLVLFSIWFLLVEWWKAFLLSVKWWKSMCKSVK